MNDENSCVEIKEAYKNYTPPINAAAVIQILIRSIPGKYLAGLKYVALTNSLALSHDRRRGKTWHRKHKVQISDAGGLYHQQWQGIPASIEIFVDNTLKKWPHIFLKIPLTRDIAIAEVLYHELGHHIHQTIYPEHREREDVAEKWGKKLTRLFIRKRYWYLLPLLYLLSICVKVGRIAIQCIQKIQKR